MIVIRRGKLSVFRFRNLSQFYPAITQHLKAVIHSKVLRAHMKTQYLPESTTRCVYEAKQAGRRGDCSHTCRAGRLPSRGNASPQRPVELGAFRECTHLTQTHPQLGALLQDPTTTGKLRAVRLKVLNSSQFSTLNIRVLLTHQEVFMAGWQRLITCSNYTFLCHCTQNRASGSRNKVTDIHKLLFLTLEISVCFQQVNSPSQTANVSM